jgi:hypothetical protein
MNKVNDLISSAEEWDAIMPVVKEVCELFMGKGGVKWIQRFILVGGAVPIEARGPPSTYPWLSPKGRVMVNPLRGP